MNNFGRFWGVLPNKRGTMTFSGLVAVVALLVGVTISNAAITQVAPAQLDPDATLFTLNAEDFAPAQRNVAADRNLRQSFQYSGPPISIEDVRLGFNIESATGGLELRVYEVADTNAEPWAPGNLIYDRVISFASDSMPTGTGTQILLTGGDTFILPGVAAPAGYAIEVSNNDDTTNLGPFRHSNDGTDNYAGGKYYSEGGGSPGGGLRDLGISLEGVLTTPLTPGDVNGDMMVDIEIDLAAIAANFRTAGNRSLGDLTGNGFIDFDDFDQWKQNFDGAFPEGFSLDFANVPEPGSALLALVAMLGLAPVAGCRPRAARRCD
jgi:hypothetical protein